jgi:lipopolysaccharide biosynthesis glycosyltransferase
MFVTVCNREYLIGFEVMLKSLVENNPRVVKEDIPFTVISNDLTSGDLITSRKIHNNISLKKYDQSKYGEIDKLKSAQTGFGDYTKYEIFTISDVDKII